MTIADVVLRPAVAKRYVKHVVRTKDDGAAVVVELGFLDSQQNTRSRHFFDLCSFNGWDLKNVAQWEKGYSHLQAFVEHEGHARVQRSFTTTDGFWLGSWVYTQKKKKKENKLSSDQATRLEAQPEWVWEVKKYNYE